MSEWRHSVLMLFFAAAAFSTINNSHTSDGERNILTTNRFGARYRDGNDQHVLDLKNISNGDYRYKLRYNFHFDFHFFTEVSTRQGTKKFLGPHGDEFIDQNGMMMHTETAFAMERIKAAQSRNNGSCNVVDVGANFGYFSLLALKLGCAVYLFEPDKKNFDLAMLNFQINGFKNFKAFNFPAGQGSQVLFDGWSSMSQSATASRLQSIPISIVSRYTKTVDWFKLDVEGYENEVVKSIPKKLKIESMSMEITWYLFRYIDYNDTFRMLHSRFSDIHDVERGVQVTDLFAHTQQLDKSSCDHLTYCQFNILCK